MKRPTTDGELWDYCQRLFGVGDWDELHAEDLPFWKYRVKEIFKVKARRKKLNADIGALADAADYCKAHRIDIRNVAWLYKHLPDSRRWMEERRRAFSLAAIDELLADAIDIEAQRPGSEWLDRLIRARGPHRQEVFDAWQTAQLSLM